MKQKLTAEEKAEQKKEHSWWNKFLYSMKQKGALISYSIPNNEQPFKTTDTQQPATGTN